MNDDIAAVDEDPFACFFAFDTNDCPASRLDRVPDMLRERFDLTVRFGGGDDEGVVEGGQLADIEDGDVARFDVFESSNGDLLQLASSHPYRTRRVGCAQYKPEQKQEANRAPARVPPLRVQASRVSAWPQSPAA